MRVVATRGGDEIADGRPGRRWTNVTMRQIGPLFGVSHSAAHRVIDSIGPPLALAPVRKRRKPRDGGELPTWQENLNATHRKSALG